MPDSDFLPISTLNKLVYCPRRFWYMYIQGELAINAPMLEGSLQHKRADTPGHETDDKGRTIHRRTWVWNDRLNIAGFADFVQEGGENDANHPPIIPVEYKHGRRGQWDNDQVQLCAQALCLEEMTNRPISQGEIFYWRSRRRLTVPFDDQLRTLTEQTIAEAHDLRTQDTTTPDPISDKAKCKHCSIRPICLPDELRKLKSSTATPTTKHPPS